MAFEGRPAALVEQAGLGHGLRLGGIDDHEVGPISFADEAALLDAEEDGGSMACALDGGLERERSLAGEFHEDEQRMLDQRQARRGLEVGLRFLVPGVRRVVGRDDVDDARGHGGADGITVGGGLDGRVAFDLVAEAGVVGVREPEVVHTGFGGQALALERRGAEERKLLGGGDVQDMQARVVAAG